jgi:hypothetical protein
MTEWQRFAARKNVSPQEFQVSGWQDRNAVVREAGVLRSGMSVRLNPCIITLIDWQKAETDPTRRQFLPVRMDTHTLQKEHVISNWVATHAGCSGPSLG